MCHLVRRIRRDFGQSGFDDQVSGFETKEFQIVVKPPPTLFKIPLISPTLVRP